jgi:hypothetical protein
VPRSFSLYLTLIESLSRKYGPQRKIDPWRPATTSWGVRSNSISGPAAATGSAPHPSAVFSTARPRKSEELAQAGDAAEDWYLELRGKFKRGELGELVPVKAEKTFADAA